MTTLPYTHAPLDRAEFLRGKEDEVHALSGSGKARFLPIWKHLHAIDDNQCALSFGPEVLSHAAGTSTIIFLGLAGDTPWFALAFAPAEVAPMIGAADFADLREIWVRTDDTLASKLVYARAMAIWHQNHPHCSRCGAPSRSTEAGHSRTCTNAACGYRTFPRTDPAVIMLITRGDSCLLGRKAEWRPGQFSTIAGFVEPGESIETAVRREVLEETGVTVGAVRYMASQPWPFPSSLMLGFRGEALSHHIRRDMEELEDCRWFTRAEVRAAESGPGTLLLPHRSSISRWLIEGWRDEGNNFGE